MALDGCIRDRRSVLGGLGVAAVASLVRLDALAAATLASVDASPLVLAAGPGKLALLPGAETAVLAFNGQVPGPLIRLKLGGSVDVRLDNRLDRAATICWRGVRLPAAMDGVAGLTQAAVKPGESFIYRFTPPDSGLYWYRPEVWPDTAALVAHGLYGVLLVDEPAPPPVDADLLLVIDDWMLGIDGQVMLDAAGARLGVMSTPLLTVNSHALPIMQDIRPGARVRLRLLNVCGTRLAIVACSGMAASVIAVDGQPSGLFEPARGTVPIGPGSRFELILDLPRDGGTEAVVDLKIEASPQQPLLRFAIKGEALPSRGAVPKLPDNPLLPTRIHLESSLKRDLVIGDANPAIANPAAKLPPGRVAPGKVASGKVASGKVAANKVTSEKVAPRKGLASAAALPTGAPDALRPLAWTMAGRPVDGLSGKPLFVVKHGSPITLALVNRTAFAQQVHVHGHVFRVLHDLDDGWDPYWRDSVLVGPARTKHVAFVADNPGRWMVEAVALDRPGPGLAAYFTVEPA